MARIERTIPACHSQQRDLNGLKTMKAFDHSQLVFVNIFEEVRA
jgi:hypothetical protein